jgi:predicted nucleotidyltransferase
MTKEEVLYMLKEDKIFLQKNFGVLTIGLFGSYAKNNQKADSDLDFFVEITEPLAKNYFGLWNYLEKRFNKKVDLVRKGIHLREKFINTVEKEIIYA